MLIHLLGWRSPERTMCGRLIYRSIALGSHIARSIEHVTCGKCRQAWRADQARRLEVVKRMQATEKIHHMICIEPCQPQQKVPMTPLVILAAAHKVRTS